VKPANILMLGSHIVLADFGVASLIDVDMSHLDAPWAGSPAYMAPEVWRYKPGRYSDQYALAVTCFRLLTGEYPWKVATGGTAQWMHLHQYVAPYPLRTYRPDLPVEVGLVLQRALAKERYDRYRTVSAFAADLRKAAQDETQQLAPPARPALPVRPPPEAVSSPAPGLSAQSAPAQGQRAQPAPPPVAAGGSTSSVQPFSEDFHRNGKDPLGLKIDITGPMIGEISQKLQQSSWTLRAFILNFVICAILVSAIGVLSHQVSLALSLAFSLCPALLVGPLVGRLFHRMPVSSYAWGALWGMIFGIVNAFLSALACYGWIVLLNNVISHGSASPGWGVLQLYSLQPSALLLLIGLWLSVCGGALIGLLARAAVVKLSAHQS
jgi:hypothetical protein